jgi:hypothetical protein
LHIVTLLKNENTLFILSYYNAFIQGKGNIVIKSTLIWSIGIFAALQAIQIDNPIPSTIDPNDEIVAPKEIMHILKTSCYDCHSYETVIPWYGHIAPVSYEVKGHIKEGRALLNFQEWNQYSEGEKEKIYSKMKKSINIRMPLPVYLDMHENAKLSYTQKEALKAWIKKEMKEEK